MSTILCTCCSTLSECIFSKPKASAKAPLTWSWGLLELRFAACQCSPGFSSPVAYCRSTFSTWAISFKTKARYCSVIVTEVICEDCIYVQNRAVLYKSCTVVIK